MLRKGKAVSNSLLFEEVATVAFTPCKPHYMFNVLSVLHWFTSCLHQLQCVLLSDGDRSLDILFSLLAKRN